MGVLFKFKSRTGNEAKPDTKNQTADKETQYTFPLSAGLLEPKHVKTIASAVWTFLWCINRTTHDRDENGRRWGQVFGGHPVSQNRIADELGLSLRSVRYQLDRLESHGYLRLTHQRDGLVIEVAHSIKWMRREPKKPAKEADKNPASTKPTIAAPLIAPPYIVPVAPEVETADPPPYSKSMELSGIEILRILELRREAAERKENTKEE